VTPAASALQDRLAGFLAERLPPSVSELRPETALFETGLLDSLALLDLVQWVEAALGAPLDPSTVELRRDWATIADIAAFIERHRPER
jgi:acyl carrier protein